MAINPNAPFLPSHLISRQKDLVEIYDESTGMTVNTTPANLIGMPGASTVGGLYSQTGPGSVVTNTTVETSILDGGVGSLVVPAYGFQVGDTFEAHFTGQISAVNNDTIRFHIHSNSAATVLTDSGAITMSGATSRNWELDIIFVVRAIGPAGTAQIYTSGAFMYNKDASNNPERHVFSYLNNTTFNTTIQNELQVAIQWGSANVGNSIHSDIFVLNKLY